MMLAKTVRVTKAVAAAGNYTAEDVISNSATAGVAWEFKNVGGSGYITKAQVQCETTAQVQRLTLYLFKATPTSALNDNVANTALLHADLDNYIGRIDFPAMEDLGGDSETLATPSTYGNLPLMFESEPSTGSIYGILVTRDSFTNENGTDDYSIALTVEP
jgi:hypothetical protein